MIKLKGWLVSKHYSCLMAFCLLNEDDVDAELSDNLAVDDSLMVSLTRFLRLVGVSQV